MKKGTLALLGEIASLLNGAIASGLRLVNNLVSSGFKLAFQFNESAMAFSRQVGLTHAQAQAYSEVLITRAKELGERYGIAAEEVSKLEKNLAKATGRVIMLNNVQAERQIQINRTVGEQTADEFSQIMIRTMGAQFSTVQGAVSKAYATAAKRGLDAAGMAAKVGQNLSMANRLTFRNGIDGLTRMVALSEKLGFNVQSIEAAANKFMDLQDSIENSAKLTMLGGAAGALGGNPLDMTYEANYDPEAFAERFTKILSGYAHFDEKTGMAKMNALGRDYVKGIADAMGVGLDEAVGIAKKQAELTYKRNNFRADVDKLTGGDEAKTDLILNRSMYNTQTGKLEMTDRNGERQDISYFFNDNQGRQQFAEMMRLNGMTDEEIVKEQAQAVVSINDTLQGYVTTIQGLVGETIKNHLPQIKAFLGDLYHSIKPSIAKIADNIRDLVTTLFKPDNLSMVKSTLVGLAKTAAAISRMLTSYWSVLIPAVLLSPIMGGFAWVVNTILSVRAANALGPGGRGVAATGGARGGAGGGGWFRNFGTRWTQNRTLSNNGIGRSLWNSMYGYKGTGVGGTNAPGFKGFGWGLGLGIGGTVLRGLADDDKIGRGDTLHSTLNAAGYATQYAGVGLGIASMLAPLFGPAAPIVMGLGAVGGGIVGLISGLNKNSEMRERETQREREILEEHRRMIGRGGSTTVTLDGPHAEGAKSGTAGSKKVPNDLLTDIFTGKKYFSVTEKDEHFVNADQWKTGNEFVKTSLWAKEYGGKGDFQQIAYNKPDGRPVKHEMSLGQKEPIRVRIESENGASVDRLIYNERFIDTIAKSIFSRADFASRVNDARYENVYIGKVMGAAAIGGGQDTGMYRRENGYG